MIPESLAPLANHLWQSTLFAVAAALLTLALRNGPARVRHWVWVAASWKFLVPFSLLMTWGSHLPFPSTTPAPQIDGSLTLNQTLDQVSQPFAVTTPPLLSTVPSAPSLLPAILAAVWTLGFLGFAFSWWLRYRGVIVFVRAGSPLHLGLPLRTISSPSFLEPGVFGVLRPTLLLPDGILDHLTRQQWNTVLAHELCHVRHRDNLIATVQMFVETLFWFYPLVWWLGKRITEERERACDEEVLLLGNEPRTYAQGILKVCELYLESPVACVSGISGSNLRRRIEAILANPLRLQLTRAKRLLLAASSVLAIATPIAIGILNAPRILAQSQTGPWPSFEVATIKPGEPGSAQFGVGVRGGQYFATNAPLKIILGDAYGVRDHQITGAPSWMTTERFTIETKAEPPVSPNTGGQERMRLMVQSLLKDRFKLALHRESRTLPVYELVVAKGGAKLKNSAGPDANGRQGIFAKGLSGLVGTNMPVTALANLLAQRLGRNIIDKTGLTGKYDFELTYTPDPGGPDDEIFGPLPPDVPHPDPNGPSLFTALQEQLGLRLESSKGPVDVLVIDHVEHPSEN
ncbi:MAG TPA: M56 and DUF3738 domain-containing protein [Bryobacteraceae bacterium]|jgi:uncharacterized protein (TIGR03435 family)